MDILDGKMPIVYAKRQHWIWQYFQEEVRMPKKKTWVRPKQIIIDIGPCKYCEKGYG